MKLPRSLITSPNVTQKEKWIGYLLGPAEAMPSNAVLATYLNVYGEIERCEKEVLEARA